MKSQSSHTAAKKQMSMVSVLKMQPIVSTSRADGWWQAAVDAEPG